MEPVPLTPADHAAVAGLLAACGLPYEDLSDAHLAAFVGVHDASGLVSVAGLEAYGEAGLLRSVAVAPPYRGHGLAARLVDAVEARARAQGIHTLYLLTTTAETFFARRGYTRTDRAAAPEALRQSPEFAAICPSTAVCMSKAL